MAIKPTKPASSEDIKTLSEEEIKREREKLQKEVENAGLDTPKNKHQRFDR